MDSSDSVRKASRLRAWHVIGISVLLLCLVGAIGAVAWRLHRGWSYRWKLAALASAIHVYYDEYGSLPETLDPVGQQGLFGLKGLIGVDRLGRTTLQGRPIRYLKASRPGFVVVVDAESGAYIVLDDSSVHYTDERGLDRLLTTDDSRRQAASQPAGWTTESSRGK